MKKHILKVGELVKSDRYKNKSFEVVRILNEHLVLNNMSNGHINTFDKDLFYFDKIGTDTNNYITEQAKIIKIKAKETKYLTFEEIQIIIGLLGINDKKSVVIMLKRKLYHKK